MLNLNHVIKNFSFLIVLFLGIGCSQETQKKNNITKPFSKSDTSLLIPKQKDSGKKLNWADSLIINYVNKTKNELIQASKKNKIDVEWNLDSNQKSDTANFYIYQIGHTFEHKFITDQWLYIDSLSKNIYEYDIGTDNMKLWKE